MASTFIIAPEDIQICSKKTGEKYLNCSVCQTYKKKFNCAQCIRLGDFSHNNSSLIEFERFVDKKTTLLTLKENSNNLVDRCEKLLDGQIKLDSVLSKVQQSENKLSLIKLAIEQRRKRAEERKVNLDETKKNNVEFQQKIHRYQKRVSTLQKVVETQSLELQEKENSYVEHSKALEAFRRTRIRQLFKYIFPVHMTYDMGESIEGIEFLDEDLGVEPQSKSQVHVVCPWVYADEDFSTIKKWVVQMKQCGGPGDDPRQNAMYRSGAALGLTAQALLLIAWYLTASLPHVPLQSYINWCVTEHGWARRARRITACGCALLTWTGLVPVPGIPPARPLSALYIFSLAASTAHPSLGRTNTCRSKEEQWLGEWKGCGVVEESEDEAEPEHIEWSEAIELEKALGSADSVGAGVENQMGKRGGTSDVAEGAQALVTSTTTSLISFWRGWTT